MGYYSRESDSVREFEAVLKKYILPLLGIDAPLKFQALTKPFTANNHVLIHEDKNRLSLRFYPSRKKAYFYFHVHIDTQPKILPAAREIMRELMYACPYRYEGIREVLVFDYDRRIVENVNVYRSSRYEVAFELGLCNWLGGLGIYRLLSKLKSWSQKTYEGNRVPFSFIVDVRNANGRVDYIKFLDSDHSAVFTDGLSSGIVLDREGNIVKFFSGSDFTQTVNDPPLTPHRFSELCGMCHSNDESTWIGLVEQTNGDILVFKNRELTFVKRNGEWKYLDSGRVIYQISRYVLPEAELKERISFAKEIYLSLLDVSFSRAGGCIAIINECHTDEIRQSYISKDDIKTACETNEKIPILTRLISTASNTPRFDMIDRKLRQQMLALDGAAVLDSKGELLGAGAIVKISGGSDGGGRTAAAKQLACYGMAIKISMDGQITGYGCSDTGKEADCERIFSLL